MTAIILIIVVFAFFAFISWAYFIGWRSLNDPNMLGGLILLWAIVALFILVIYLNGRNRQSQGPSELRLANFSQDAT